MFFSFAFTAFRASKKEFLAAFLAFFVAFAVFVFVDSLSKSVISQIEREARPALGADVTVSYSHPFSAEQEKTVLSLCAKYSAVCSRKVAFSSTLVDSAGKTALVRVEGVEPGYPYYGSFEVAKMGKTVGNDSLTVSSITSGFPSDSGFIAESSIISRFAPEGELPFFGKKLRVEGEVRKSPDAGFSFGQENGTVIISYGAAMAIPEISTVSKANFSILAKTPNDAAADALSAELKTVFSKTPLRSRSFRGGAGGSSRVVDDVNSYVSEALAIVFFLAGTAAFFFSKAVWITNRRYFSVLRILGASRISVSWAFTVFFLAAAVLAAIAALSVSASVFDFVSLPDSMGVPVVGFSELLRLLKTFPFVIIPAIAPAIAAVFATAPLSGLGEPRFSLPKIRDSSVFILLAFWASALFLIFVSGLPWLASVKKAATVVVGISAVLGISYFALRAVSKILLKLWTSNFARFDAVRLSVAPGSPAFPVVSAFVVPAVLFASFASLAFHFSSELERLSNSGYDVFALNLLSKDEEKVRAEFPQSEAYSIILARVSKINGKSLSEHLKWEPSREFSREFNITSSALPDAIISGANRPVKIGETSVDSEFSKSLNIGLGDLVTFSVMGREFELSVVNVRDSTREWIRPFFYFQVAPGEFAQVPLSYFVAAKTQDVDAFKARVLQFSGPYVSFIDVRETTAIVRSAAERILPAVWIFLAAIATLSLTVAIAALASLRNFRLSRERAYRAIGASREFLWKQVFHTLAFYAMSAFLAASVVAFPAAWGGIASVSFLKFSFIAAAKAVAVLFGFLTLASLSVAAFERK